MCISIVPLGVYFYLDEHKSCSKNTTTTFDDQGCDEGSSIDPQIVEDIGWLPLVCLMVYVAAFSIGFGPLPWAMNAELFPQEAKEKGSAIMTM